MFMKVKLHDRNGDVVVVVTIPQFRLMPEVLIWSGRYFTRRNKPSWEDDLYMEGFAVHVVPIPGVAKNDGTD